MAHAMHSAYIKGVPVLNFSKKTKRYQHKPLHGALILGYARFIERNPLRFYQDFGFNETMQRNTFV